MSFRWFGASDWKSRLTVVSGAIPFASAAGAVSASTDNGEAPAAAAARAPAETRNDRRESPSLGDSSQSGQRRVGVDIVDSSVRISHGRGHTSAHRRAAQYHFD